MAVDAFSGDAIPVHLLTREAAALYGTALRDDAILAIHATNLYLDLGPVIRGMGRALGMEVVKVQRAADPTIAATHSTWYLLTRNQAFLARIRARTTPPAGPRDRRVRVWTDGFSDLLEVLR